LPGLKIPVLILHSRADTIVPFHHAEENFARAREPKRLWELQGDHNDTIFIDPDSYRRGIGSFLESLEMTGARPGPEGKGAIE
jgi:hypothetical protein